MEARTEMTAPPGVRRHDWKADSWIQKVLQAPSRTNHAANTKIE